jgi:membrane protein YqaA with SNARE-associated domain
MYKDTEIYKKQRERESESEASFLTGVLLFGPSKVVVHLFLLSLSFSRQRLQDEKKRREGVSILLFSQLPTVGGSATC